MFGWSMVLGVFVFLQCCKASLLAIRVVYSKYSSNRYIILGLLLHIAGSVTAHYALHNL